MRQKHHTARNGSAPSGIKTTKRLTPKQIANLAAKLGVQIGIVEQALETRGKTKKQNFSRLNRVQNDFYKMFRSDRAALQAWINTRNAGLGDKSPAEIVGEGRVEVLERARDAMKTLQFG